MASNLICPEGFRKFLDSFCSNGVKMALIFNSDGNLFHFAQAEAGEDQRELPIIASALFSRVWSVYQKAPPPEFGALNYLLMEHENGWVGISRVKIDVASYFVCMLADNEVHTGSLKSKVVRAAQALEEPLRKISESSLAAAVADDSVSTISSALFNSVMSSPMKSVSDLDPVTPRTDTSSADSSSDEFEHVAEADKVPVDTTNDSKTEDDA